MEYTNGLKETAINNAKKHAEIDPLEMTILTTLQPQASSTVERKTLSTRLPNRFAMQNNSLQSIHDLDESKDNSLGLVNNISNLLDNDDQKFFNLQPNSFMQNIEMEKRLARQLLLKCSQPNTDHLTTSHDTDKENDVNIQNLTKQNMSVEAQNNNATLVPPHNISTNSVVFEPIEFTARSSEMNKSNGTNASINKNNTEGFSFNATDPNLISRFGEVDFMSGSAMMNRLESDEVSWRQNFGVLPVSLTTDKMNSFTVPNAVASTAVSKSNDRNRLELTCFSGFIGDLDLTVQSSANGRRVSVGEYFERKCDMLGNMSLAESAERPNFGLNRIRSPERINKCHALVNDTAMQTTIQTTEPNETCVDSTINTQNIIDIMSLSKIAEVLQEDGSPRQLVDMLVKQKIKQKNDQTKNSTIVNATSGTYTVLSARSSVPVVSSTRPADVELSKLSLDKIDRMKCDSTVEENTLTSPKASLISGNSNTKTLIAAAKSSPRRSSGNTMPPSSSLTSTKSLKPESPPLLDVKMIKQSQSTPSSPVGVKPELYSPFDCGDTNEVKVKQEDLNNSSFYNRFNDKITIGKSTQDLYNCTIGVPRGEVIEINNDSIKWIVCTCKLHRIQGNQDNIDINISSNKILIAPHNSNFIKISVNFLKPGDPILAAFSIEIMDMTSHEKFTKEHMMCFIPEASVSNENSTEKMDEDTSEIDLVDTPIPIILEKNEVKSLSLKNISNQIINLTATIVQPDKLQKLPFTIEPKEIILHSEEIGSLMISYQGFDTDENVNNILIDKQAIIKIKTNKNNTYLYPLIGRERQLSDENIDDLRCNTPPRQQQQVPAIVNSGVPLSPQSTTSSNKFERNSPRSSVSAASSTVADDSIPIKTNHSALVWTTVRVGKCETREFTIRGTSNNKIKLQAVITDNDNSFKFLKDRNMSTTITILLQHMERKTFTVIYHPNSTGPVAGKITFSHYVKKYENKESRPSKIIPLYGCGGHTKVCISQALRIMGDQRWLSLGKLNPNGTLSTKMTIENNGDIPAYVKISLTPKVVYPSVGERWNVEPTELILGPREIQWITIKFRPRREDIVFARSSDSSHIGTLTITHGDEPTRWRIRRLYKKMFKDGQVKKQGEINFRSVIEPLCDVFPGEKPIPNLHLIRDSVADLETLCRNLNSFVITLIMESNADDTTSIFPDDDDDDSNESKLFQSLITIK